MPPDPPSNSGPSGPRALRALAKIVTWPDHFPEPSYASDTPLLPGVSVKSGDEKIKNAKNAIKCVGGLGV